MTQEYQKCDGCLCKHLKIYGNAWVLPKSNLLGGKSDRTQVLSPPRLVPDIDPVTDRIRGWMYKPGPGVGNINLEVDQVWHLRLFSVDDYRPIGDPPLSAAILDIEADMSATAFNNQVFQKGGMIGMIIGLEVPEDGDPFADEVLDISDELQERMDTMNAGTKTGQGTVVSPYIKNVWTPTKIGGLDASFKTLRTEVYKIICNCLGLPSEKIGISRTDHAIYSPSLVEDSVNSRFDKMLNSLVNYVDEFINEKILKERFGIYDVVIQSGGRYGALTRNAADTILTLAQAGPILTVNEALDKVLGWEPLSPDNPRGQIVLDNSINRDAEAKPALKDPVKDNMDLGKSITAKDFINWIESQQGAFETKDVSYCSDEEIVHKVIIKNGRIKFLQENRPNGKADQGFRKKHKETGSDQADQEGSGPS